MILIHFSLRTKPVTSFQAPISVRETEQKTLLSGPTDRGREPNRRQAGISVRKTERKRLLGGAAGRGRERNVLFALLTLLILTCVPMRAQSPAEKQSRKPVVNLSLWKNIATHRSDTTSTVALNLGIVSQMNALSGFGTNLLSSTVLRSAEGLQLAGISNLVGKDFAGVQLAGITNIAGSQARGVVVSGMVNITGAEIRGLSLTGLVNIAGGEVDGMMASGLINIASSPLRGGQLSGMCNIAADTVRGAAVSGLMNVAGKSMRGVQLSALGNVVGEQLSGAQISLANLAVSGKGVQLGLVNYYKEDFSGIQLGLVNANPQTRVQLMLFAGNRNKFNIAARFKNKILYTTLGIGLPYNDADQLFSTSFFYRAGAALPLGKRLSLTGDLGYQHIETFRSWKHGLPARLYGLQARVSLEYELSARFALFATGGYGGTRFYQKDVTFDKGIILECGLILLRI